MFEKGRRPWNISKRKGGTREERNEDEEAIKTLNTHCEKEWSGRKSSATEGTQAGGGPRRLVNQVEK